MCSGETPDEETDDRRVPEDDSGLTVRSGRNRRLERRVVASEIDLSGTVFIWGVVFFLPARGSGRGDRASLKESVLLEGHSDFSNGCAGNMSAS